MVGEKNEELEKRRRGDIMRDRAPAMLMFPLPSLSNTRRAAEGREKTERERVRERVSE